MIFSVPFDVDYAHRWCAQQGVTLAAVIAGEVTIAGPNGRETLGAELLSRLVMRDDPVAYCEVMLRNRPEQGGGAWRLFEYQKPSMRYRGHVVHEDGAGVGKTREIEGLTLWFGHVHGRGSLIGGALDVNLEQIWQEIEFQREANPLLASAIVDTRLKPYRDLVWRGQVTSRFRPCGHDGRAFRGEHIHGLLAFDEAAKPDNEDVFTEFFSRRMPGAEIRLYSVPDGRLGSPFARICQRATPYREGLELAQRGSEIRWVKFNWPRTLMPPPHWTKAIELEELERYGGRDTPGYVRNVLGMWGDPEDSIFPWGRFSPCLELVDAYRVVKILDDTATGQIYVEAHRLNPSYQVRQGSEALSDVEEHGPGALLEVYRDSFERHNFSLEPVLRRLFQPLPNGAHATAGCDVGQSNDPSEIHVNEERGGKSYLTARLQIKGMSYDQQAEAIAIMDRIFRPNFGWGMDSGGVGKALEDALRGTTANGHFRNQPDRLQGFVFNVKCDARNPETGEPLTSPDGTVRRVSYKQLGTELLVSEFSRGRIGMPWDSDLIRDFSSHTAHQLRSGELSYSTVNDHTVDAQRVRALRRYELDFGQLTSPPLTFALPPGSARDTTLNSL